MTKNTYSVVLALLTAVLIATTDSSVTAETTTNKPNILFIFADDIGYEALNCYGRKERAAGGSRRLALVRPHAKELS